MNWINAKERLPEDGQKCLVYTPFYKDYLYMVFLKGDESGFTIDHFWMRLCDTCEHEIILELDDHDIYWMPIDEILKPEVK